MRIFKATRSDGLTVSAAGLPNLLALIKSWGVTVSGASLRVMLSNGSGGNSPGRATVSSHTGKVVVEHDIEAERGDASGVWFGRWRDMYEDTPGVYDLGPWRTQQAESLLGVIEASAMRTGVTHLALSEEVAKNRLPALTKQVRVAAISGELSVQSIWPPVSSEAAIAPSGRPWRMLLELATTHDVAPWAAEVAVAKPEPFKRRDA